MITNVDSKAVTNIGHPECGFTRLLSSRRAMQKEVLSKNALYQGKNYASPSAHDIWLNLDILECLSICKTVLKSAGFSFVKTSGLRFICTSGKARLKPFSLYLEPEVVSFSMTKINLRAMVKYAGPLTIAMANRRIMRVAKLIETEANRRRQVKGLRERSHELIGLAV